MGLERYTVLECIGEGSFGRVYRGRIKETGQIVAMKFIPKVGKSEKSLRNLKREIEIMQSMHHKNIIEMIDTFETEREVVAITDYAEGDLFQIIEDDGKLPEGIVQSVACQLVSALYYLHAHRILHRDMKPQNILLGQEGVVKLCDFGFARIMSLNAMVLTSIKGTPLYMAPELVEEKPYDHTADLWALGCILYELFVGTPPFYTNSIFELVRMITRKSIHWPPDMSPEFKDFLTRLLQKDTRKRLQWPGLLEHPFVVKGVQISPGTRLLSSPFTQPLTPSQLAEKERQTRQMLRPNGSRMLRRIGGERIHSLKQVKEEERTMESSIHSQSGRVQNSGHLSSVQSKDLSRGLDRVRSMITQGDSSNPNDLRTPKLGRNTLQSLLKPESFSQSRADNTVDGRRPQSCDTSKALDTTSIGMPRRPMSEEHRLNADSNQTIGLDKNAYKRQKPSSARGAYLDGNKSPEDLQLSEERRSKSFKGWWLRSSADAWERLVEATDVDFAQQASTDLESSRHSSEHNRLPQRRTALSLLNDVDFARRVALRLASASVMEDKADWRSMQPWTVALTERRSLTSRSRQRPVSAETHSGKELVTESFPGLEAAAYLRNLLRLLTNLITVKCDVAVIARFCAITEMPSQLLKLMRSMLACEKLKQKPWYEQILLDLVIALNGYFVSEIGHRQNAPESAILGYTEHALCFMELVPELLSQPCDQEFHLRDQTLLCLRYMMERMVDRESSIVHKFYADLIKFHLPTIRNLIHMPSLSRHVTGETEAQRLDDVREHALAALTAFTYPLSTTFTLNEPSRRPSAVQENRAANGIMDPPDISIRTHEIAAYIAKQLCMPDMETHMRLYISYLWMPRLSIHTAKLIYDCIQADPGFARYCTSKFPVYLDALFELLQKKVSVSETDQFTLTEIVTHSMTALVIQLGSVPNVISQNTTRFCKMFVDSHVPSHAAAFALLLSRLDRTALDQLVKKTRDLVQAIAMILVSPLAQSSTARSRLLSAMSETVSAESARSTGTSSDQTIDFEIPMSLGLPQLNWPANHGWLDGVFDLALSLCTQDGSTFVKLATESHVLDRIWQCLEQVFDLSGKGGPTQTPIAPDWTMLSPRGVCVALQLTNIIYTKENKLCVEALGAHKSQMLSCLTYLFTDTFIRSVFDSPWSRLSSDSLMANILTLASHLLQIPLYEGASETGSFVPSYYLDNNLLVHLIQAVSATELSTTYEASGFDQTHNSINVSETVMGSKQSNDPVYLARLQSILRLAFRICHGPFCNNHSASGSTPDLAGLENEKEFENKCTDMLRSQLCALLVGNETSESKTHVKQVHRLIRRCISCPAPELRAGACVLLNQAIVCGIIEHPSSFSLVKSEDELGCTLTNADNKSLTTFPSTSALVLTILGNALNDSFHGLPEGRDTALTKLLSDSETIVVTQALNLVANLVLTTHTDRDSTRTVPIPPLKRSDSINCNVGQFYNQQVCRPILTAGHQLHLPQNDPSLRKLWDELFEYTVGLVIPHLESEDKVIRQSVLLVLGNAAYRFPEASVTISHHLGRIVSLLTDDASARVRANAASTLCNLSLHSKDVVEMLLEKNVSKSLLETSCYDGDRRVQESALATLRVYCEVDGRFRKVLSHLGASSKLLELLALIKRDGASRSGRKVSARSRTSSKTSAVDSTIITEHVCAVVNCL
ncbi:unnamed protein product [Calicophoron daubneyi]|uniref:non-specific serine/threonine protein kinase n=1 Tax=Calicophoron daubneyi TaxID=300641 RepID=A0AAV2SY76_CALDB